MLDFLSFYMTCCIVNKVYNAKTFVQLKYVPIVVSICLNEEQTGTGIHVYNMSTMYMGTV